MLARSLCLFGTIAISTATTATRRENSIRVTPHDTFIASLAASPMKTYTIQDAYDTSNFFDGFDFYSDADPTNGFVKYYTTSQANSTSLAGYANGGIYLGSDHKTANPTTGRGSTRINSKKTYTHGLFIADIAHMPTSSKKGCGLWPAFWMFGEEDGWPNSGEIDVIEGVNSADSTTMTLHTSSGCTVPQGNCNAGNGSTGCSNAVNDTKSFGAGFNSIGGGVYAVEWTSDAISIWFFPRDLIPSNIDSGSPDPSSSSWGTATATFSGSGCDIDSHFKEHTIVFNIDFCGDWAGEVWSTDETCSALADTCQDYVSANPVDFQDAYWLINSVRVYSDVTLSKRDAVHRPFMA